MPGSDRLPLPVNLEEARRRGWDELDIVLVNGDAYVDHPSFGLAIIGRLLESHGYRVGILAQPSFTDERDFHRFGRPRLFFGVSGGNLDSVVANYSANGKVRDFDAYSPGGSPWRGEQKGKEHRWRPDRAVLLYSNLARRAFPATPIILGGLEASLRRFIHFDFQQQRLRSSHLSDAKADLLIYGMAERAILEVAERIDAGRSLEGIPGTCRRATDAEIEEVSARAEALGLAIKTLPSWQDIVSDTDLFMDAETLVDRHARAADGVVLRQRQQAAWILQFPPAPPLQPEELDRLYDLPYSRRPHPSSPNIPAFEMVKDSLTIVRGCCGNCSFCAISRHQGAFVTSRTIESIEREARLLASEKTFRGTISDLGGPTANLFATSCAIGSCRRHDCLYPAVCRHLLIDEKSNLELLSRISRIPGVKHTFISSGLRLELLLKTPGLLEKILKDHTPGALKIAPEHTEPEVLELMHKEAPEQLERFVALFRQLCRKIGKQQHLSPYIISAHPGCEERHAIRLIERLQKLGLTVRSFQDFTPTPGTLSTAMFVTGRHRDRPTRIHVARTHSERLRQRQLIERAFLKKRDRSAGENSRTRREGRMSRNRT